jgi:hypothetical protein
MIYAGFKRRYFMALGSVKYVIARFNFVALGSVKYVIALGSRMFYLSA